MRNGHFCVIVLASYQRRICTKVN